MLRDFLARDMVEQITLLEEIKESGRHEALPALAELYATPHADQAVDESVYHTLFALLARDGAAVVDCLRHPAERVRLVAVRRAGVDLVPEAKAVLVEQLRTASRPEVLAATIKAVGQFDDPELADLIAPLIDHDDDMVAVEAMQVLVGLKGEAGRRSLQHLVARLSAEAGNGRGSLKLAEAVRLAGKKE